MPDLSIAGLDDWGLWLAGVAAGLTALVVFFRAIRWVVRLVRRIVQWAVLVAQEISELHELAQYELRPNGGGSIKDHAAQVPALVGRVDVLAEQVAGQRQVLDDHLTAATQEQTSMWDAIQAIARSQPPEETPRD